MATGKALNGKPYAGNPHVRFDEGEVASAAMPRRGSLLYKSNVKIKVRLMAAVCAVAAFLPSSAGTLELEVLPGESWFGGGTAFGHDMPWTSATRKFSRDLRKDSGRTMAPRSTDPAASRSRRPFHACRTSWRLQSEPWHSDEGFFLVGS